jgi:hypothetical protein
MKYSLIVVTSIVGICLYQWVDWKGLHASDWASWIQALGSIGAIIGAFLVVDRQHRRERELEDDRQRLTDIRRLKSLKAVLTQICTISSGIHTDIVKGNAERLYHLDPQALMDYKAILQALPLFEIPSPQLAMQLTLMPRAIGEVASPMFKARNEANDEVIRYEFLLAFDIEERAKRLYNLAADANNYCVDELFSLNGYSPEELPLAEHS